MSLETLIKIILLVLLLSSCSITRHKQSRVFDSTIIIKDSIHISFVGDSSYRDTVKYSVKQYHITHTPNWLNKYSRVTIIGILSVLGIFLWFKYH
jgi:hypothetical protein